MIALPAARPPLAGPAPERAGAGETVRLCAGDGTPHTVSRAALQDCKYFEARLAAGGGPTFELDVDDASLRVILTLLRYGAEAVPALEARLRVMVLRDADRLGLPRRLWAHLTDHGPERREHAQQRVKEWEQTGAGELKHCSRCRRIARRSRLECITCGAAVGAQETYPLEHPPSEWLYLVHECPRCGIEYAIYLTRCVFCDRGVSGR
jgi:hypothetical protein